MTEITPENGNLKDFYDEGSVRKRLHETLLKRKEKRKDPEDEDKGLLG
jgi:hypothetical protein